MKQNSFISRGLTALEPFTDFSAILLASLQSFKMASQLSVAISSRSQIHRQEAKGVFFLLLLYVSRSFYEEESLLQKPHNERPLGSYWLELNPLPAPDTVTVKVIVSKASRISKVGLMPL